MKRCPAEGRERFELWVAAAVLANNLMKIAALLAEPSSRRRKAAQQYPSRVLLWRKDIRENLHGNHRAVGARRSASRTSVSIQASIYPDL
jgi:hypothetical protein